MSRGAFLLPAEDLLRVVHRANEQERVSGFIIESYHERAVEARGVVYRRGQMQSQARDRCRFTSLLIERGHRLVVHLADMNRLVGHSAEIRTGWVKGRAHPEPDQAVVQHRIVLESEAW